MAFRLRIKRNPGKARDRVRIDIALTVLPGGIVLPFRVDTGNGMTTVSEGVAKTLGLPGGGEKVGGDGPAGDVTGRVVTVSFRFPPDPDAADRDGFKMTSEWVVIPGQHEHAQLGLYDIDRYFDIQTDRDFMYFEKR